MKGKVDLKEITEDNVDKFQVLDCVTGEMYPMYLEVPCGKCLLCQDRRKQSIVRRLCYEAQTSKTIPLFVTLTLDNEHYHHLADKSEIQNFIKRVREYF